MKKVKVNKREKNFLIICGLCATIILIWAVVISPFNKWRSTTEANLREKRTFRDKMRRKVDNKSKLEKDVKNLEKTLANANKRLLSGDKPPIAAASLQALLKEMINKLGIELRSERIEEPMVMDIFTQIPVKITVVSNITKLKDFLFEIESSSTSLSIAEFMIRVTNTTDPKDVEADIKVVGLTSG